MRQIITASKHVKRNIAREINEDTEAFLTDLQVKAVIPCFQKYLQTFFTGGENICTEICAGGPNLAFVEFFWILIKCEICI